MMNLWFLKKRGGVFAIFCCLSTQLSGNELASKLSESRFQSYHEFAKYTCLPCHTRPATGTDLVGLIEAMDEQALKQYLDVSLNQGNMPPDEALRAVLIRKLNYLNEHLPQKKAE